MKHNAPDISVSIVSYNTCALLRTCLRALQERQDEGEVSLQIIVIDNDSHDGSAEMVEAEFPKVLCVRSGGNLGYGRANNVGFSHARGRYFCVLNSDAEVLPGALRAMLDWMDAHPEAGACGAQLLWPDGRPQSSHGDDPVLLPVLWEQLYLDGVARRFKAIFKRPAPEVEMHNTQVREVEQLSGACLFVRAEVYRQIGGFDAAYFMYVEDVDFNVRLRQAGWKIFWLPQARIRHHLGGSSSSDWRVRAKMVSSYNWSRYLFYTRVGGASQGHALKMMVVTGATLRLLIWTLLALSPKRGSGARDKIRLFRVVLRRALALNPAGVVAHSEDSNGASH